MSIKNHHELIGRSDLTQDQERYISERTDLRQLHEQALASGQNPYQSELDDQDDEDGDGVAVEDWVADKATTKVMITEELDKRDVAYDPKSSRIDLGELLVKSVRDS